MFFDIGPLELITLVIMAIVIFGPDKLPKLIQDATGFIRKVRAFADSAKADIRSELGPEFKDFEFEDLNPKTFVRKNLMGGEDDPLGLKDLREGLDLKSVLDDKPASTVATSKTAAAAGGINMLKTADAGPPLGAGERPPYDLDAT
ncbi:sec-independent translocase [Kitasatospora sp. GAS204B]|uniref:sec-independent translocase n=1 Tax=unclassified Kitasatospora TaxID=2633591 RepID=UPI0024745FBD|nr:sec-independent translocase [Kitasatospora sp. GAS204B]MDH6116517.1 sec-independent protein translocase protein TatB [Kitasatospora sp. GAS204B]